MEGGRKGGKGEELWTGRFNEIFWIRQTEAGPIFPRGESWGRVTVCVCVCVCTCGAFAIMVTLTALLLLACLLSPHNFPHSLLTVTHSSLCFLIPSLSPRCLLLYFTYPTSTYLNFPFLRNTRSHHTTPPALQPTLCSSPLSIPPSLKHPSRCLPLLAPPSLIIHVCSLPKSGCKSETCQQPSQSTMARDRFLISHRYCHFGGIERLGGSHGGGRRERGEH